MEPTSPQATPPDLPGLAWRPISKADLAAVVELGKACLKTDGGLAFLFEPEYVQERCFPEVPGAAIGAFTADGCLQAYAVVFYNKEADTKRAQLIGQVHPDLRRHGLGTYLMSWSQAQAQALLAEAGVAQGKLQVATESLTHIADSLYRAWGFESVFEELVMQWDLRQRLPERSFPAGATLATWEAGLGSQFYQAYHAAFKERPGFPGTPAEEWVRQVVEENDLRPDWTLLAWIDGEPAGFVLGNADLTVNPPGGYIAQVGVVPARRRLGLCSALLVETMRRMQAGGVPVAHLTVHVNNPGAIEAYARLGFKTVGRRARYERLANQ